MSSSYYNNHTTYTQDQHQGLINLVITTLDVPEEPTIVSKHYSNDRNIASEIQAYAKISGKDWTYYVKHLDISIGRDTDSSFNILPPLDNNNNNNSSSSSNGTDIDLGPAKVVSRNHARIKYNIQIGCWELHVLGRNGAKVNFQRIHSGINSTPIALSSGTILDIGGTQMIFILPDQTPILSEIALDNLMPRLIQICGIEGNTNNKLINDLIKNSHYAIQERERLQLQQNLTLQQQQQQNSNNSNSTTSLSSMPNPNEQIRIFKMYSSTKNSMNGLQSSYNSININNNNNHMNQLNELSGPTTITNSDFAYSGISQLSSQSSLKRIEELTKTGFPNALDYASDLSLDENRAVKPPHSYATMITQAILSSLEGIISLADIYRFISTNYSYYRYAKTGWQNSIRHNLSLNKAFEKVPRRPNEPGKGMKWRISVNFQTDFLNAWYTGNLSKIKRGSSVFRQLQMHMSKYNKLPGQIDDQVKDNTINTNPNANTDISNNTVSSSSQLPNSSGNQNVNTTTNNNNTQTTTNDINRLTQPFINNNNGDTNPNNSIGQYNVKNELSTQETITFPHTKSNDTLNKSTFIYSMPNNNITNNQYNNNVSSINNSSNNALLSFNRSRNSMDMNNTNNGTTATATTTISSTATSTTEPNVNATTNENVQTVNNKLPMIMTSETHSSGPSTATSHSTTSSNVSSHVSMLNNMRNGSIPNINQTTSTTTTTTNNNNNNGNTNINTHSHSNSISTIDGIQGSYDALLRSPTKAFQITAMEAYTPERGSTINQKNKSPQHENENINNINNNITTSKNNNSTTIDTNGTTSVTTNTLQRPITNLSSNIRLTPSANKSENNGSNSNILRSSPGVWNLLQFSSVNNTPAVPTVSIRENDLNHASSSRDERSGIKDIASSPLKSQDTSSANHGNRSSTSMGGTNKDLILDTGNAKLTIVDDVATS